MKIFNPIIKKKALFVIILLLCSQVIYSRSFYFIRTPNYSSVNVGFGAGIDYAGLGGRVTVLPTKSFGLFGMAGYNFLEYNYGGGIEVRLAPDAQLACPYVTAMYGYNAVIIIEDAPSYNKTYNGLSISAGIELHIKNNDNFFNIELVVPFRTQKYRFDLDTLENNHLIRFYSKPWPVGISVGFHFGF